MQTIMLTGDEIETVSGWDNNDLLYCFIPSQKMFGSHSGNVKGIGIRLQWYLSVMEHQPFCLVRDSHGIKLLYTTWL